MKFTRFTYGTFSLLAFGGLAWGCSSKGSDCNANKDCGPYGSSGSSGQSGSANGGGAGAAAGHSGEAGEGGASGSSGDSSVGGSAGSGGTPCVGTSSPDLASCVISDEYGLFVSLSGDDITGDGTEAHPLATVTQALTLTGPGKINRIYVCTTANGNTASYAEPDTLVIPDHVSIYGGFTCAGGAWSYDATVKAYLKPQSAIGATITSAQNGVTIQDLRIDAQDAAEDGTGASSFGMIVTASQHVLLTRVEIHAGKGGGGAAGMNGPTGADGVPSGAAQNGTAATCTMAPASQAGGASVSKTCGSQGGNGGTAFTAVGYSPLQDGAPGFLVSPTNGGTGAQSSNQAGGGGQTGANGASGVPGAAAATTGLFSATGYQVASGGSGAVGAPGQGGGGGGASLGTATCVGASGGAGGMGGCGGDPGKGGIGGGASVAVLNWNSGLSIDACGLFAASGGAGGKGGDAHVGGLGKAGGAGGAALPEKSLAGGGRGGDGGPGGNGGNGAGGTGGPSLALVYSGNKPSETNAPTLITASGGAHGSGGQIGLAPGPDGSDGLSQAEYEQP